MTRIVDQLSHAVVLYLGYGAAMAPARNEERLLEFYGRDKGLMMIECIKELNNEAAQIPIDWESVTLEVAGEIVRSEMHCRYPNLDSQALEAIAWKFTYDWR